MRDANGMRIIISTRCLINRPAGIGHNTAELVRALSRRSDASLLTYPSPTLLAVSRYRENHLGWWEEKLIPVWRRKCSTCGEKQTTTNTVPVIKEYKPVF